MIGWVVIGDWSIRLASLTAWLFVINYACTAPFWKSEEGWLMMAIFSLYGVVLGYFAVTTLSRHSIANFVANPWQVWVRLVIGGAVLVLSAWAVWLRVRRHAQGLDRERQAVLPPPLY